MQVILAGRIASKGLSEAVSDRKPGSSSEILLCPSICCTGGRSINSRPGSSKLASLSCLCDPGLLHLIPQAGGGGAAVGGARSGRQLLCVSDGRISPGGGGGALDVAQPPSLQHPSLPLPAHYSAAVESVGSTTEGCLRET